MVSKDNNTRNFFSSFSLKSLYFPCRLSLPPQPLPLFTPTQQAFSQVDGRLLWEMPGFLSSLIVCSPPYMSAALDANLTPALVRIICTLRSGHYAAAEGVVTAVIDNPIITLMNLVRGADARHATGFWKPAIDAGVVPIFIDLLTFHWRTVKFILWLSHHLLAAAPSGSPGAWAGALPRAIAGLISAGPPKALDAVEMLFSVGLIRKDVLANFHTWGVSSTLQRLTTDESPNMAAAAKGLVFLVDDGPDVSCPAITQ